MKLDLTQINSLYTGVVLATELKSKNPKLREFLTIEAYTYNSNNEIIKMDKFIKEQNLNNIYFEITYYEIFKGYEDYLWDYDYYLKNKICKNNIKGINKLEIELTAYIKDNSVLKPQWHFLDAPF